MTDAARDTQEIELKFEIDPEGLDRLEERLTIRAGSPEQPPVQTLVSTYYDTDALDLQKAGLTLRVRQHGKRRVQTVKSEGDSLFTRGEWECDLIGEDLNVKALSRTPIGPMLTDGGLILKPVFATRMNRTLRLIREPAGEVEAALDRGHIEADGRITPVCELELELKAGQPQALFGLARRLAEAEPLRLSFQSKAERGFRLLADHAPEAMRGEAPRLGAKMTVAQAFVAVAAQGLRQLTANAETLRTVRRPEALHQTRVAIRRLRTAFKLFEPAVRDKESERLAAELKWLARELDQARDLDVMIAETFTPAAARFHSQDGMAGLGKRLHAARGTAYDSGLLALDSPRYLALTLDLAAWLDSGDWRNAADPLFAARAGAPITAFAAAGLDRLRKQIKRRGQDLKHLSPELRHKLRIRAKRLRYALEFFGDLYRAKPGYDRFAKILKGLQDSLGQLNDLEVARAQGQRLAEAGGRAAGEGVIQGARQAFAAGLMIGARAQAEKPLLKEAAKLHERLVEAERFWR